MLINKSVHCGFFHKICLLQHLAVCMVETFVASPRYKLVLVWHQSLWKVSLLKHKDISLEFEWFLFFMLNISDSTDIFRFLQNLRKCCMSSMHLRMFKTNMWTDCPKGGCYAFHLVIHILITCHWSTFIEIAQGRTEHAWYIHPNINVVHFFLY